MNCKRARRSLSEWIDSGCPAAGDVGEHVAACAACSQVADDLRRIAQAAGQLPARDAPADLFVRVLAADDERRRAADTRARGFGWLGAVGVAATAATVAAVVMLSRGDEQGAPARPEPERVVARPPAASPKPEPPEKRQAPSTDELLATAQAEFERAERHYRRAISQLREIADKDSGSWKAQRKRSYLRELMVIEQVVAHRRNVAQMAPSDPSVQEMLYRAYRRQINHMQEAILAGHERQWIR
jgi:hypothetical protein